MPSTGSFNLKVSNNIAKAWRSLDRIGFKKFNAIYLYNERPDPDNEGQKLIKWEKLDPTPKISNYDNYDYSSGGQVNIESFILRMIPFSYPQEKLNTASEDPDVNKFYIIDNRAYITTNIEKRMFDWQVKIRRYITNQNIYTPPEDL